MDKTRKRDELYYTLQCRHFNGIQHDACNAGVDYSTVRDHQPGYRMARWPCLIYGDAATTQCDKLSRWTPEESAAMVKADNEAIALALTEIAHDICPHCHVKVEKKKQVGSCVYGEPCGHRLYQGKC